LAQRHQIYLVPGFFGFARLGDLNYFHYVQDALTAEMSRLGADVQVIPVDTLPTASIVRRGRRLLHTMRANECDKADAIHIIGHSTGGLDARVVTSPALVLDPARPHHDVIEKIRTVVTLATPHFGTPIAGFFTTAYGKNLLQLLSLLTLTASSQVPAEALSLGFRMVTRMQGTIGITDSVLIELTEMLLRDFTPDRREMVRAFMQEIWNDQGALLQLTPEAMDLFNAAIQNHPEVRYLSFVNAAPPPSRVPPPEAALNPLSAVAYFLYRFMWDAVADFHPHYPYHHLTPHDQARWEAMLRLPLDSHTNDGVVPSRSMFWGECVGALRGDHLDLVGHFGRPTARRRTTDWLRTGSGFGDAAFIGLYRQIARHLVLAAPPPLEQIAPPTYT